MRPSTRSSTSLPRNLTSSLLDTDRWRAVYSPVISSDLVGLEIRENTNGLMMAIIRGYSDAMGGLYDCVAAPFGLSNQVRWGSLEHRQVREDGWEVAWDGVEMTL